MTYATLKDGKFLLFEAENPEIRDHCKMKFSPSYPCDGSKSTDYYCKCHEDIELFESSSESAIVASDQEQVRDLLTKKCDCLCHTSGAMHFMPCCDNGLIHPESNIFYPLEGYRIEVKERSPSEMEMYVYKSQENIKTARLVKE